MTTLKVAAPMLVVAIALSALLVRVKGPARDTRAAESSARYAMPGPHAVGTRTVVVDGPPDLTVRIWYPAAAPATRARTVRYPYRIKIGAPVGSVPIAFADGSARDDAEPDPSRGPYPLAILSPGFSIGASAYGWLAEHLASYGIVVIAPEHQETLDPETQLWRAVVSRPQDILSVLSYVDAQTAEASPLGRLVDTRRVAVVGHSLGGYTALTAAGARIDTAAFRIHCDHARETDDPTVWLCDALVPHLGEMATLAGLPEIPEGLWPSWADSRVGAVVSLAGDAFLFGEAGLASLAAPVMAIGGTADTDTPYGWGTQPTFANAASDRKAQVALEGAEHMIFAGPCERVPLLAKLIAGEFCEDAVWNRHEAQALVKHLTTAFLMAELRQDTGAAAALAPEAVTFPSLAYAAEGY